MSIQSLGVGSGLALDDLVRQLLEAERKPRADRLDRREEKVESEISALGSIKSKLSDFKDAVDKLRRDRDINSREPSIKNPNGAEEEIFSAEASVSALRGDYEVAVERLASGTRIETAAAVDGGFSSPTESVLSSGTGALTFQIASTGQSFSVSISAGTTLAQLREQINNNQDNFGVTANIIDTGTATGGAKLVFSSSVTGAANELSIINDNDIAELNRLSTTDSTQTASFLTPARSAANARATVDGIVVESSTNRFENTIQNVSFEAKTLSPVDSLGAFQASRLTIGFDREGLETKVRDFVSSFNSVVDELRNLTRFGESELEDDGPLAGDSLMRGIQTGLTSIVGGGVSGSALGGLFQLGIEIDQDGKLQIGTTDLGFGSGENRFSKALDDQFDEVAKLFTDENSGVAVKLFSFLDQFTARSGVLSLREREAKDNRDQIFDEREQLELRMFSLEETLRDRYLNLDQTVARLNQTGFALLASLGR